MVSINEISFDEARLRAQNAVDGLAEREQLGELGQPIPPVTDASYYFPVGFDSRYLRLDDRPTPPFTAIEKFFEQP